MGRRRPAHLASCFQSCAAPKHPTNHSACPSPGICRIPRSPKPSSQSWDCQGKESHLGPSARRSSCHQEADPHVVTVEPVLLHLLELALQLILPLHPLLSPAHVEQPPSHLLSVHVHHSLCREEEVRALGNHPVRPQP